MAIVSTIGKPVKSDGFHDSNIRINGNFIDAKQGWNFKIGKPIKFYGFDDYNTRSIGYNEEI